MARHVSHAIESSPDGRRIHRLDRRIGDCTFTLNILLDETARGGASASASASSSSPASPSAAAAASSSSSKTPPAKRTWHVSAFDPARAAELSLAVDGDVLLATLAKEVKRPPPEDPAQREEYLVDALAARLRLANGALVFAEHGGA